MSSDQGNVLVVDDDEMTRILMARYLERHGLAVTGVPDGSTALTHVEQGRHDLVLLDVFMEGMNGLETLQAIRRVRPAADLPVIMATARDQPCDVVEALRLGASDYVSKPFDYSVVLARVQTHLALKRSTERMRRDLAAAARVQAALLPAPTIDLPGAHFACALRPCTELAGDLLNVVPLDGRRVVFYVLDVTGHGAAAALLAVMVHKALGQMREAAPAEVAARLNREFPLDFKTRQSFTLLYAVLALPSGEVRFVSAGHPGPAHLPRQGPARAFNLPGFPIGWVDGVYEEQALVLAPGDRLYLYSDGATEAPGPDQAQFGEERLLATLEAARGMPLAQSVGAALRAVEDWGGGAPPRDDVSLLAVERTAEGPRAGA
jgi:sigma-B regulation protein RsbU (phosphoserine phosphatase)